MLGFRYYLLSPSHTDADNIDRLNTVYENWVQTFKPIVESGGGKLNPDDFFRQDLVGALFYGNELVGSHLSTAFDTRLQSNRDHHYLHEIPSAILGQITQRDLHSLLSIEYLNVLPQWRKHSHEVSWCSVVMSLALGVTDHTRCESAIGMPKIDRKANEVAVQCGCITIADKIDKMGHPCSVILRPKGVRKYPDDQVKLWTERLWDNHVNAVSSNIFENGQFETQTFKKAA